MNFMMKYIPPLLTIILLISCSKKSIDDDMTVYSFDGEYNLCGNWYVPKNVFDKNEKDTYLREYEGACNVPITIENNAFNWYYDGDFIDCVIVSRQDEYGIFPKQLGLCGHPDGEIFELHYKEDGFWLVKIDALGIYPNFKIVLSKNSSQPYKDLMTINNYTNPYTNSSDMDKSIDLNWSEMEIHDNNFTVISVPDNLVITDGSAEAEELGSSFDAGCIAGGILGWIWGDTIWDSIGNTIWCTELGDELEDVIVDSEVLKDDGSITNNNYCAQYFSTTTNNFNLNRAAYVCIPFEHPTDQSYEEYLPKSLNNVWHFVTEK